MLKIDRDFLDKLSPQRFGDVHGRLAAFLLAGDLRPYAGELGQLGTALVPVDNLAPEGKGMKLPGLGVPGFAIPIRWIKQTDSSAADDPYLPACLVNTAVMVRRAAGIDGWVLQRLGIHWKYDLSAFPVEGNSGFLPLAVALVLANAGARPRPEVWSTGAWDEATKTIQPVTVGGKWYAWQASKLADGKFFAPAGSRSNDSDSPKVDFVSIVSGPTFLKKIEVLLQQADKPPADDASLDAWIAYFGHNHNNNLTLRNPYYAKFVQPLGERARRELPTDLRPAHLVLTPSPQRSIAMLAIATWQPQAVHLLLSNHAETEVKSKLQQFCASLPSAPRVATPSMIDCGQNVLDVISAKSFDFVANYLEEVARQAGDRQSLILVDITAGTSAMTAVVTAAALQARQNGVHVDLGFIASEQQDNVPQLGTERAVVLRV